jgi:hypothetical protein
VAARLYTPERSTRDLDIAVWYEDAPAVRERLAAAGFVYEGYPSIGAASWHSPAGLPLDVVELRDSWARQALEEARDNRDLRGLPILPLPYLVLMKFSAGRLMDMADLSRILGQAGEEELKRVRELFAEFRPNDREDLESLVYLGRPELQGPGS